MKEFMYSGTVGGKTSKTVVLPGFFKIEGGGGSGGAPPYWWSYLTRANAAPLMYIILPLQTMCSTPEIGY
jgi:hypothetical protein